MKTLIINGSPKVDGDTSALLQPLLDQLKGEVRVLSVADHIQPCNDCRSCWESPGCTIEDDFTAVYPYLYDCDNVVIASLVWFSSLSGPALNIGSRIQYLYASDRFRGDKLPIKKKKGAIFIVGAEPGTEEIPMKTARTMMKFMKVNRENLPLVCSMDTNHLPTSQDGEALEEAGRVALWMNEAME